MPANALDLLLQDLELAQRLVELPSIRDMRLEDGREADTESLERALASDRI
jgi:hypothetical protein